MSNDKMDILKYFYTNLETLNKIKVGDKLYTDSDNNIKIDEPFMFQGLWRYCNNISRKDAIFTINKLINDIEICFNTILLKSTDTRGIYKVSFNELQNTWKKPNNINESDIASINNIIPKLKDAIIGINNLKQTYQSDNDIINELELIIQRSNNLIISFQNILS